MTLITKILKCKLLKNHDWEAWRFIKSNPSGAENKCKEQRTCKRCKEEQTRYSKRNHQWSDWNYHSKDKCDCVSECLNCGSTKQKEVE